MWFLLTFMVFDCILLKLPWSLIDIQLSIQYGDRKEQHSSNFWPNCAYACFFLSIISNVLIVAIMFSHFIMVSSSIPYVNHHSIYGNTNLVVECARYFEKSFPFLTWGYCVSLYLWNTIYYIGTTLVLGVFDSLCRIYVCDYECYTLPMGSVHIWKSQYLHPDGVISDLICLLMPACLKFSGFLLFLLSCYG